jgi:hypothetical protein
VTPGVITEKLMKFLPLIGRLSICCRLSTDDTAVFVTSTTGDSPVTVNCSAIATPNRKSTVIDWPRSSTMPVCVRGAKPCAVTVMSCAWREGGGDVPTSLVSGDRSRDVGVDVPDGNARTSQDGSGLVDYGSFEVGTGQPGLG